LLLLIKLVVIVFKLFTFFFSISFFFCS